MTIPDFQTLMRPLLKLGENGDEIRTSDCVDDIANQFNLTDDEKEEMLPSGRQPLLLNRIHWARTYLGKAEVITSPKRGYFKITDRGLKLLQNGPERITIKILENYPEFKQWRDAQSGSIAKETKNIANDEDVNNDKSAEERLEEAHSELNEQLKADILQNLYNVSPSMFEKIIVDLLISMGYGGGKAEMGKALMKNNDGGVDGIIKEDELGLDVVYVQAKKHKLDSSIGRPDIQSFAGSLEGFNATKGVFVTTAKFAHTVKDYVERIHKRIVLIDGQRLASLMVRHGVGVRTKDIYELKDLDEDYFLE